MKHSESEIYELAMQALDSFQIEIPSWGFANTGTRFGKFVQPPQRRPLKRSSPTRPKSTGYRSTPSLALHVLWDLPNGVAMCPW